LSVVHFILTETKVHGIAVGILGVLLADRVGITLIFYVRDEHKTPYRHHVGWQHGSLSG
jgi:hypothetical protein